MPKAIGNLTPIDRPKSDDNSEFAAFRGLTVYSRQRCVARSLNREYGLECTRHGQVTWLFRHHYLPSMARSVVQVVDPAHEFGSLSRLDVQIKDEARLAASRKHAVKL